MSKDIKEIAGNLEYLNAQLDTVHDLMMTTDGDLVTPSRFSGLIRMIKEQMDSQIKELYSYQESS
jgi:hypothetical protein